MVNGTSSANGTSLGFDICMNAYSIDDLLQLLDLGSNPSQAEIVNKIYILNNMFNAASDEIGEDNDKSVEEIQDFFNSIQDKLLDNFKNNTSSNAESANYFDYNIENPLMSQLPLAAPNFEDDTDLNPEELIQCYEITQEEIDMMNRENQEDRDSIIIQEREPNTMVKKNITHEFHYSNASVYDNKTVFKFTLPNTLTNITDIQLANITVPLPYTFSEYKNNNMFYIIDNSNGITHTVNIPPNCLYLTKLQSIPSLVTNLNNNFSEKPDTSILHYISVKAILGTDNYTISFDLSENAHFSTFTLDFNVPDNLCGLNYSLANILGFTKMVYSDISNIKAEKFVSLNNGKLYMSLDDYTMNYTQQYIVPSNIYNKNILCSFNLSFNSSTLNNFSKDYTTSLISKPIRYYNGYINLLNFEIQFYDNKGNIQQLPEEYLNDDNFNFNLSITYEV